MQVEHLVEVETGAADQLLAQRNDPFAQGDPRHRQRQVHFPLIVTGATAIHQAELFETLEQGRQGSGVEQQAVAQGLHRRLLRRARMPLPEHQHDQVLRVGQADLFEQRPIAADHRARGGVQLETQLVVEQQRFFDAIRPGDFSPGAHSSSASIAELSSSGLVVGA